MPQPQAVLFDLGETVLHQVSFHPEAWADALPALAAGPVAVERDALRALARQLVVEFRRPSKEGLVEVRMEACLRHLHERLGLALSLTPADVELAFWRATSVMEPEPGIGAVLDALRSRGVPVGLVSNSMFRGEVLEWELARHGLRDGFRFVMSSADYALRKPHPSLFRTAARRLGLPPEQVRFVGDSFVNDVAGAHAAGMRAVWYNPTRQPAGEPVVSHAEISHWGEFLALCDPMSG
jgi:putative hydrolase of the HAD superfamily